MNRETRDIILGVLFVIVVLGVGFFLLTFGFAKALNYAVFGIPALFILIILVYYVVIKGSKKIDPETMVKIRDLNLAVEKIVDLRRKAVEIDSKGFGVDTKGIMADLDGRLADLEERYDYVIRNEVPLKADYDASKIGKATLPRIHEADQDLDKVKSVLVDSSLSSLKNKTLWFKSKISELSDSGYDVSEYGEQVTAGMDEFNSDNLSDIMGMMDEKLSIFVGAIESSIEAIKALASKAADLGKDASQLEMGVSEVQRLRDAREYDQCISSLVRTIRNSQVLMEGDFNRLKSELMNSFDTILAVADTPFADKTLYTSLADLKEELSQINSAERIQDVERIGGELVSTSKKILERMFNGLQSTKTRIMDLKPPDYYWENRSVGSSYETLMEKSDIDGFPKAFRDASGDMTPMLEYDTSKYKILGGYRKVIGPKIDRLLSKKGAISVDEIGAKTGVDELIKLHTFFNSKVKYDPAKHVLSLEGASIPSEVLDLTVLVSDDAGKPIQGSEVVLKKEFGGKFKGVTDSKGLVTFSKIKRGEYKASVVAEGFKGIADKIGVYEGGKLGISLEKKSLRDELCAGQDQELLKYLDKYSAKISAELDKNQYMADGFRLGIKNMPGFLYLWSERDESVNFIKHKKGFMIYRKDAVLDDLTMCINNMNPDLKSKYHIERDLVKKYLRIPLPINEVKEMINDLHAGGALEHTITMKGDYLLLK